MSTDSAVRSHLNQFTEMIMPISLDEPCAPVVLDDHRFDFEHLFTTMLTQHIPATSAECGDQPEEADKMSLKYVLNPPATPAFCHTSTTTTTSRSEGIPKTARSFLRKHDMSAVQVLGYAAWVSNEDWAESDGVQPLAIHRRIKRAAVVVAKLNGRYLNDVLAELAETRRVNGVASPNDDSRGKKGMTDDEVLNFAAKHTNTAWALRDGVQPATIQRRVKTAANAVAARDGRKPEEVRSELEKKRREVCIISPKEYAALSKVTKQRRQTSPQRQGSMQDPRVRKVPYQGISLAGMSPEDLLEHAAQHSNTELRAKDRLSDRSMNRKILTAINAVALRQNRFPRAIAAELDAQRLGNGTPNRYSFETKVVFEACSFIKKARWDIVAQEQEGARGGPQTPTEDADETIQVIDELQDTEERPRDARDRQTGPVQGC